MSRFRRTLPLQSATLSYALDSVGLSERGGDNSGPFVDRVLRMAGMQPGAPWCAAWVFAMAEIASMYRNRENPLDAVEHKALVQSYADWARRGGRVVERWRDVAPGDLFCLHTGRTEREYDHIGLVDTRQVEDGLFPTVEGNTTPDVNAGSARDREGDVVARKERVTDRFRPLVIAWGRDP